MYFWKLLTGPTKPSREVLVKGLSLIGAPVADTGIVCKQTQHSSNVHRCTTGSIRRVNLHSSVLFKKYKVEEVQLSSRDVITVASRVN